MLKNSDIAELLALEAERVSGHLQKALITFYLMTRLPIRIPFVLRLFVMVLGSTAAAESATLSNPPPGAIVLFDGNDLAHWHNGGRAAGWNLTNGLITIVPGTGAIVSWATFDDLLLHLEFRFLANSPPGTPENSLHNSGVFFQDQFEVQITEAFNRPVTGENDGGSIWSIRAADTNASLPNGQWETYDITFHAARWTDGIKISNARVTMLWNGIVVHDDVEIPRPTRGVGIVEVPGPGPLILQDLVGMVQFRNIWALPLSTSRPSDPKARTLVAASTAWRYLDDGSDQGTAWRLPTFDDTGWSNGLAEFGYGDNDGATPIRATRGDGSRITTTYFRKSFVVTNRWALTNVALGILRDDGAIAYLNGTEIYRGNMNPGPVTYLALAPTAMSGAEETRFYTTNVHPSLLVEGTNWLAVEIHQQSAGSTDVSFNARLTALEWLKPAVSVRRGPSELTLEWPVEPPGFVLESAAGVEPGRLWRIENTAGIAPTNGFHTQTITAPDDARFFRLRRE
jgi:hypothetical protein